MPYFQGNFIGLHGSCPKSNFFPRQLQIGLNSGCWRHLSAEFPSWTLLPLELYFEGLPSVSLRCPNGPWQQLWRAQAKYWPLDCISCAASSCHSLPESLSLGLPALLFRSASMATSLLQALDKVYYGVWGLLDMTQLMHSFAWQDQKPPRQLQIFIF